MSQQLWYVTKPTNGEQSGPHTVPQLKELAESGQLELTDLLWTEGWNEWRPVSTTALGKYMASLTPSVITPAQSTGRTTEPPPIPAPIAAAPPVVSEHHAYYVTTNGQQTGPYTIAQLKERADSGKLRRTDSIWRNGWDEWKLVSSTPLGTYITLEQRRIWPIAIAITGGLLLVCFVLPWWELVEKTRDDLANINVNDPRALRNRMPELQDAFSEMEKKMKVINKYDDWYEAHAGGVSLQHRRNRTAMSVWGWGTTPGQMSFILGSIVIPLGIVSLCIRRLCDLACAWMVLSGASALGGLVVIVTLIWISNAPSEDVLNVLHQGTHVGPYACIITAGALVVVTGIDALASYEIRKQRRVLSRNNFHL